MGQLFVGDGPGGQVSTPPSTCVKEGQRQSWVSEVHYHMGTLLPPLPPSLAPTPHGKLETIGNSTVAGVQTDRLTEERALAYRIHYEKAIHFSKEAPGFLMFFVFSFFVCLFPLKKITILLPLPRQLTGSDRYHMPGGGVSRGVGGAIRDFINKRQVPDLQFVNIS